MAESPLLRAEVPVRISLFCAGVPQSNLSLVSVSIRHAFNAIPWARLVLDDGDMPNGSAPISDSELFAPGASITVKAGYGDTEETVFTGTVVRHGFKISGRNQSQLVVECQASAAKMSLARQTAHHVNQTDAEIIQALVAQAGLAANVAAATITHRALVQYDTSDWAFMLARAAAVGLLVNVEGEQVSVQPPQLDAAAALSVSWGNDLMDFDAHVEASPGALPRPRGRMSFQGSALAKPGAVVELAGVGARFNGKALLSVVAHELADGNWLTHAEFGLNPEWLTPQPPAALPQGVVGLQSGVVRQLEGDPEGEYRVLVNLPTGPAASQGLWARLLQPQASTGFGSFFLPEVGDEVLVGYLSHDPSQPVVLGSLYSNHRKPPYEMEAGNNLKAIVTRSRHKIEFNDADKTLTLTTPARNQLVFSDQDGSVVLQDQNGNSITLTESGITLNSPKDIAMVAQGGISLAATGAISLHAKADVKVDGLNIACQAQIGVSAKGNASAELSAAGQTTVRGALVMIN